MLDRRRGNSIFVFCERLAGKNDRLIARRRWFVRLRFARRTRIKRPRRSVFGWRQIAAGGPAIAPAALASPPAIAPTASTTVIRAATSAAIGPLIERALRALKWRGVLRGSAGDGRGGS